MGLVSRRGGKAKSLHDWQAYHVGWTVLAWHGTARERLTMEYSYCWRNFWGYHTSRAAPYATLLIVYIHIWKNLFSTIQLWSCYKKRTHQIIASVLIRKRWFCHSKQLNKSLRCNSGSFHTNVFSFPMIHDWRVIVCVIFQLGVYSIVKCFVVQPMSSRSFSKKWAHALAFHLDMIQFRSFIIVPHTEWMYSNCTLYRVIIRVNKSQAFCLVEKCQNLSTGQSRVNIWSHSASSDATLRIIIAVALL